MTLNVQREYRTSDLYKYFFGAYKARTAIMIIMMVFAGLAEGIGVLTLIPVLEFAGQTTAPEGGVGGAIVSGLARVNLPATLEVLLTIIVVTITLKSVFLLFAGKQIGFTVSGVTRDLRLQLLRALFDVRWSFYADRTAGQITNSVMHEANASASAYAEACRIVAALLQMGAYLLVATAISWQVSVVALVTGAALALWGKYFIGQSRLAGQESTQGSRNLSSRLTDVLQGIKALKAMNRQGLVWPLLEHEAKELNRADRRAISASETLKSFQEPLLTLVLALGLYFALRASGQPLSEMLVMAFVLYRLITHINTIQMRYQFVVKGESAFFSVWESLRLARANREPTGGSRLFTQLRSGIRLEDVHFGYGEREVLRGASATIPVGSFTAIMGESGAGKTTLIDLLVGLYQPDRGRILVDETPLEELDLASWRAAIGYVPQEMLLFTESVLMNITLGDPRFDRSDAERALRLAGAWEFVEGGGGLDRPIGERGGQLSGGQRQRIAIARALIGRPALLILDEVTASLDPDTEQAICDTLSSLGPEVTILSISHQPAMKAAADHAFSLRGGRLVEARPRVSS